MVGLAMICGFVCAIGAIGAFACLANGEPRLGWRLAALSVVVPVGIFLLGVGIGSGWTVSEGERVGVVQKVSERGMFIKTVECEVALLGAGNEKQIARVWEASLDNSRDNAALKGALDAALQHGGNVRIKYREVLAHAPWRMETDYTILSVEGAK